MPAPPITELDRAFSRSNVLIRDLDPTLQSVLSARAEARGQSLQQYLTAKLNVVGKNNGSRCSADTLTRW